MSTARDKAVSWALDHLGLPVLMGHRGHLRFDRKTRTLMPHGLGMLVFDCSGFICAAYKAAGALDMSATHNAQLLHDEARELASGQGPLPGDAVFYGTPIYEDLPGEGGRIVKVPAEKNIIHVVMWLAGGHVISADGATWSIGTLEQARAARAQTRLHQTTHYRHDCPYVRARRAVWLDNVDRVSR